MCQDLRLEVADEVALKSDSVFWAGTIRKSGDPGLDVIQTLTTGRLTLQFVSISLSSICRLYTVGSCEY